MRLTKTTRKILWIILGLGGLVLLYLLTRLINLTNIPIFTDEAIYLRWGQIALGDPRWRFISLIDGKQPLLIWLFLPMLKLISDPLVAGRLVSVIAGLLGMTGLSLFSYYLTRSIKGLVIGGLLYILIPFFLVYDRLAIYDTLLAAIAVWSLFFSYILAKKQELGIALILGTIIGAGLLTKSSADFFLVLLPATILLLPLKRKNWFKPVLKWGALIIVVLIQSQIYNNILRLSEFRHIIGEKNLQFLYSPAEMLKHPLQNLYGNLVGLTTWTIGYLTVPILILIVVACLWYFRKNHKESLYFIGSFAVPYFGLALFGKVIYPRFILFMIVPLLIPTMFFLEHFARHVRRQWLIISLLIVFSASAYFDFKLLTDPIHAPLPYADRQQLLNDWPSGYGIKEVVEYLKIEAKNGPIIVGTDGTFGLYPMALELYLGQDPNVTFKAYYPLNEFPKELIDSAKEKPTFLLFKERQEAPQDWPLLPIAQYQRGDGPTYLKFFRVVPKS